MTTNQTNTTTSSSYCVHKLQHWMNEKKIKVKIKNRNRYSYRRIECAKDRRSLPKVYFEHNQIDTHCFFEYPKCKLIWSPLISLVGCHRSSACIHTIQSWNKYTGSDLIAVQKLAPCIDGDGGGDRRKQKKIIDFVRFHDDVMSTSSFLFYTGESTSDASNHMSQ